MPTLDTNTKRKNRYYGPFLGPLNSLCHIILRTQKGTIVLTTTHYPHTLDFVELLGTQRAQHGLFEQYTLNHIMNPYII